MKYYTKSQNIQLASISGGSKKNAIPRYSESIISLENKEQAEIEIQTIYKKYSGKYPKLKIELQRTETQKVWSKTFSQKIISYLQSTHSGVYVMSNDIKDLVQSSSNLGVIETNNNEINITQMIRSSDNQELCVLLDSLIAGFENVTNKKTKLDTLKKEEIEEVGSNYKIKISQLTAGWKAEPTSYLLNKFQEVCQTICNKKSEVKAIHAGLECGFLKAYFPNAQIISFGPEINNAHSPQERVKISSVEELYKIVKELITAL